MRKVATSDLDHVDDLEGVSAAKGLCRRVGAVGSAEVGKCDGGCLILDKDARRMPVAVAVGGSNRRAGKSDGVMFSM